MPKPIIAFQGRLGAYSESACLHLFGTDAHLLPLASFEKVFESVRSGEAHYAVLPFENSTTGSIHENFDLMLRHNLHIIGEVKLFIEHALLAVPGTKIEDLTEVRSHPQALAQCSQFFNANKTIRPVPEYDTAGSAEIVAQKGGTLGAIASCLAAEEYGLTILKENLENEQGLNQTRFWCLAPKQEILESNRLVDKLSITFSPKNNVPGTLHKVLGVFAEKGLDLLKIESRPLLGSPWSYVFYLDVRIEAGTDVWKKALEEMGSWVDGLRVLGLYPDGQVKSLYRSRK